jgi:nitroreductase
METERAILGRRSVRAYEDKAVPEDVVQQILKAGAMAPSAMDAQPCRFVIIADRERLKEMSDYAKSKLGMFGPRFAKRVKMKEDVIFYGAPLLVLIVAEKGTWTDVDCALAAQNMMLRAYDLGIGSCFIGLAKSLRDNRDMLRSIGIDDSQELYCSLIFGYPKKWPEPMVRDARIQKRI